MNKIIRIVAVERVPILDKDHIHILCRTAKAVSRLSHNQHDEIYQFHKSNKQLKLSQTTLDVLKRYVESQGEDDSNNETKYQNKCYISNSKMPSCGW